MLQKEIICQSVRRQGRSLVRPQTLRKLLQRLLAFYRASQTVPALCAAACRWAQRVPRSQRSPPGEANTGSCRPPGTAMPASTEGRAPMPNRSMSLPSICVLSAISFASCHTRGSGKSAPETPSKNASHGDPGSLHLKLL